MKKMERTMKRKSSNSSSSPNNSSTKCISRIKTTSNKKTEMKIYDDVQVSVTAPIKRTSIYKGVTRYRSYFLLTHTYTEIVCTFKSR